jgi:hypothetical protein
MVDRLELARLWQSILQSAPDQLFGWDAEILMDISSAGDHLPQPGFVGPARIGQAGSFPTAGSG